MMRIDRYLSKSLLITRKEARKLIRAKVVKVNNKVINEFGFHVNEEKDEVFVDEKIVTYEEFHYYLFNKPAGYVCANHDREHLTVFDYNPLFASLKLHTVGRLDKDTTGVLLLTNDGALTHRLTSPKYKVPKTYFITTDALINPELVGLFKEGFVLAKNITTLPAKLEIVTNNEAKLTIYEGKHHQVKRMFKHFGLNVIKLHREQFASLRVDNMRSGDFRKLTNDELKKLIKD